VAVANDTLNGFPISVGQDIITSINLVVKQQFENPDEFNPDRYTEENYATLSKIALDGFGAGPHRCIGKHLALLELKLISATLFQKDQIKVNLDTDYVNPIYPVHAPKNLTALKIAK